MLTYRVYQLKKEHFHGKAFESYDRVKEEYGEPKRIGMIVSMSSSGESTSHLMNSIICSMSIARRILRGIA